MKKAWKELDPKTLTTEQKIGQLLCANLNHGQEDVENALELIRNHALGAIWIQPELKHCEETLRRVYEVADYPILVMCDAEEGVKPYNIPQQISITAAGAKSEYAYSFGRITATALAKKGFNVVCNPLVDMATRSAACGHTTRTFGGDMDTVIRLSAEVARGTHDGGLLTVAKHYPGGGDIAGKNFAPWDSHMRETCSDATKEDLLGYNLKPYIALNKMGLIDGVMTGHKLLPNIDPDRPASLSRPVLSILREQGFDGFYVTDALNMMGVVLKFGVHDPNPLCIQAGNDLALAWGIPCKEAMEALKDGYARGLFTDAEMEESLRHVLEAQHKVTLLPEPGEIMQEDVDNVRRITEDSVAAVTDPGVPTSISRDGKHFFIIMTDENVSLDRPEDYTPGPRAWFIPTQIAARLKELFPNSGCTTIPEFPVTNDIMPMFDKQVPYDDVVFLTFYKTAAYTGREHFAHHLVDFMDALQSTDRIVAHLHFGSPFVATDAPHVPLVLIGYSSVNCVNHALEILAGNAPANGIIPYAAMKFNEKGHIFY